MEEHNTIVVANQEPRNRNRQRSTSRPYNSLCLMCIYLSLKGVGSRRKTENPCFNEYISKTIEFPTVISTQDTGNSSKSNAGNKFSRADKSYDQIMN